MTLDEIRSIVANSGKAAWHVLSGDAPTYLGQFVEHASDDEHWQEFFQHERRAVLRRDIDVGLVWGMAAHPLVEGESEPYEPPWTEAFLPGARKTYVNVVEVLYRGQPVDRELYSVVDNAHGLVPYPEPRYAPDADLASGAEPEALEVNRWQFNLAELLGELGVSVGVGSVEDYMRRCGITVAD
jgi:hypothetical protein